MRKGVEPDMSFLVSFFRNLMMGESKPLEYSGMLYSEEHNRKFAVTQVLAQIVVNPTDNRKFALHINGQSLSEWFKEQIDKLCQSIRQPIQPQKKSKGFKL